VKSLKPLLPDAVRHDIRSEFDFLERFRVPLEAFGIAFDSMKEIAVLKATLVVRSAPRSNVKWGKGASATAAISSGDRPVPDARFFSFKPSLQLFLIAFFLGLAAFLFKDPVAMLFLVFVPGFILQFMDTLTLVPVLVLDTRDASVLATRPVDGRTVAAAKTLILISRLGQAALAVYGLPLVPFLLKGMWTVVPGYLLAALLSSFLAAALAYLLYGLVLRFADGEKLKDLLTAFQILMSVIAILGYQVLTRLSNLIDPAASPVFAWWHLALPPLDLVWLAAAGLGGERLLPGLAALGVVAACLVLHLLFGGRLVEDNLLKMLGEGEKVRGAYRLRVALNEALGRLLLRDRCDRAFWSLGYALSANDRRFKQVLYPSIAAFLVVPFIFLLIGVPTGQKVDLAALVAGAWWLPFTLYLGALTAQSAGRMVMNSEQPKGATLFEALPHGDPRRTQRVCGLNLIWRFGCLPMLVMGLVFALVLGPASFFDTLPVLGVAVLGGLLGLRRLPRDWPFSLAIGAELPGAIAVVVQALVLTGVCAGCHLALRSLIAPWAPVLLLLPIAGLAAWCWRSPSTGQAQPG
jgi:hypothetical protein